MNSLAIHHISITQRTNLEVLRGMADMVGLMDQAFSHLEKLLEWNLQLVPFSLPGSSECTKRMFAMGRPQDLLAMQIALMQFASGQAFSCQPALSIRS